MCRNIMAFIDKRITYEDDKKENIKNLVSKLDKPRPTLNGNVISIFPIPHEKPWWHKPEDQDDEAGGGLESLLASAKDDFNFYYGILSRYYAPTELRGKTLKELDEMLQLHIKADGGLF